MKKTKRTTKRKLKGEGIIDWAKNAYRVVRNPTQALSQMPKQVSDSLKKYGDFTVREIIVGRTKVLKVVQTLLNAITLGNFNREKQKYGYDDIFHLYAVLVLDNGVKLITERNQRIVLTEDTNNRDNVPDKISISTNIKLNQLFQNAINADGDKIWRYDSLSNNCQNFITSLLRNSGYLTAEANTFINQKVDNLLDPTTQNIAQKTTDFASLFENIIKGGAVRKKKPTVKEIKAELKRLKVKGITGKKKPELLLMLKNANH
jgi:hypothetical protein